MIIQFTNRVKKKSRQAVHKILQTKIFNVSFLSRAEIIFNNFPKEKKIISPDAGQGGWDGWQEMFK